MQLTCTTIRAQSFDKNNEIQRYLGIANTYPSSSQYRGINGSIDFSDPRRIVVYYNTLHSTSLIVRGDPTHGFPHADKMTNITCWSGHYYLCFESGILWCVDIPASVRTDRTWRVIINANRQVWDHRHDFVALVEDSIGLVRCWPSRERCETVTVYTYTLSVVNPLTVNYVNPSMQSRSSDRDSSGSQIGNALGTNKPEFSPCKICLSDDSTISRSAMIPCGHVACFDCVEKTLIEQKICPFCRGTVSGLLRLYE